MRQRTAYESRSVTVRLNTGCRARVIVAVGDEIAEALELDVASGATLGERRLDPRAHDALGLGD